MSKLGKTSPAERRDSPWGDQDTEVQVDPRVAPGIQLDTFRAVLGGGGSLACCLGTREQRAHGPPPSWRPWEFRPPGWPLAPGDRV